MCKFQKRELLSQLALFKDVPRQEIERISQKLSLQTIDLGEYLATQGEVCEQIYIIHRGLVRAYVLGSDGEEATVGIKGVGDVIGFPGVGPSVVTMETLRETEVLVFSRRDFNELVNSCQQFSVNLLGYFSSRIGKLMVYLAHFQLLDLKQRAWRNLQDLAPHFPRGVISLSQEELARIIGGSRPRVSEILEFFRRQGLIRVSRRAIIINTQVDD